MAKSISRELMGASSELIILYILKEQDSYGYEIMNIVRQRSDNTINWKEGSLYPVLKKLEAQGCIKSEWQTGNHPRARKYYSIQNKAFDKIKKLEEDFQLVCSVINKLNPEAELHFH